MQVTLMGIPVEASLEAPAEKIIVHPDILATFMRLAVDPDTRWNRANILGKTEAHHDKGIT